MCYDFDFFWVLNFSNQFDFYFPFVSNYDKECETKQKKNQAGFKKFEPKTFTMISTSFNSLPLILTGRKVLEKELIMSPVIH